MYLTLGIPLTIIGLICLGIAVGLMAGGMYLALGIFWVIVGVLFIGGVIGSSLYSMKLRRAPVVSRTNFLYIIPAFIYIYVLFIAASLYRGDELTLLYCLSLLGRTVVTFTLEINTDLFVDICAAYPVYYAAAVLSTLIAAATIILSIVSLFSRRLANRYAVSRRLRAGCDIVLGECEDSFKYISNTSGCVLLLPDGDADRADELSARGYAVIACPADAGRLSAKLRGKPHNIIIFRSAGIPYSKAIELFSKVRASGCKVMLNIEAAQDETGIIKDEFIEGAGKGGKCVTVSCFSRYEAMARKLVTQYPITKFIPRSFYNENLTVKDGKQINVVFVGFGKVNYQLFRMFSVHYQFAAQEGDKIVSKPVNFYMIDSGDKVLYNEMFAYIEYEFGRTFVRTDLPKPDNVCNLIVKNLDSNAVETRKLYDEIINENSFTLFVVSLKDDLHDASYARILLRLFPESDNFRVLVRARGENSERLGTGADSRVIYFGNETEIYSHKGLIDDEMLEYARRINLQYSTDSADCPAWLSKIAKLPEAQRDDALKESVRVQEHHDYMVEKWEELPYIEQDSNLSAALNMPFKVHMLGLGLTRGAPEEGLREVTREQYNIIYDNGGRADGYKDTSCFFETRRANVMAFIEHARWTAMYMLHGYRQMRLSLIHEVTDKNGKKKIVHKDGKKKLHACVTSYEGLLKLVKYEFAMRHPDVDFDSLPPDDKLLWDSFGIYRYDYNTLDALPENLRTMGYTLTIPEGEDR